MQTHIEEATRREKPDVLLFQELAKQGPNRDKSVDGQWNRVETRKVEVTEEVTAAEESRTQGKSGRKDNKLKKDDGNKERGQKKEKDLDMVV